MTNKSSINGTITTHQRQFKPTNVHFISGICIKSLRLPSADMYKMAKVLHGILQCLSDRIKENIHSTGHLESSNLHLFCFFYKQTSTTLRICLIIHQLFSTFLLSFQGVNMVGLFS